MITVNTIRMLHLSLALGDVPFGVELRKLAALPALSG
jgi:hypothetical protein